MLYSLDTPNFDIKKCCESQLNKGETEEWDRYPSWLEAKQGFVLFERLGSTLY